MVGGNLQLAGEGLPDANFDSFWRSFLTCFIVVTLDEWPSIMRDCQRATSPAAVLFFVTLVILGCVQLPARTRF